MVNNYYAYVYIDPRNLKEFYFGKGKGSRMKAHVSDSSDLEKAHRKSDLRKSIAATMNKNCSGVWAYADPDSFPPACEANQWYQDPH